MTRYAGDYFGVVLDGKDTSSKLLDYFPGLKKVVKTPTADTKKGTSVTGEPTQPPPFAGFKVFDKPKKKP